MGWRERFGGDDERAQIAARARALLDTAGARPSPGGPSPQGIGMDRAAPVPPVPSPRGGWVPSSLSVGDDVVPPPAVGGRHAVDPVTGPRFVPVLLPLDPDEPFDPRSEHRSWRERVRFDPGRRGLVAVAAVVVVVGSVAGGVMFRGGQSAAVTVAAASGAGPSDAPTAPVATTAGPARSSAPVTASTTTSSSSTGTVTVDVAGLVVRPGVYTLPAGSRVEDALREAGGVRPGADLSTLNRARVLADGEQLAVGVPGATAPVAGSGPTGGTTAAGGLVDLNTASAEQLDTLPDVGPVLAQAIVAWRTDHGRFSSVDDLDQVSGIGPATFAKLKDLVTV